MRELGIAWDRRVEGEEQHNNTLNLTEARRDLADAVKCIRETGTPRTFCIDDVDTGMTIMQPMDWDFIAREEMLLNRLEQNLARAGISYEPHDDQHPT